MKALGLTLLFWTGIAVVVTWSLGIAASIDAELYVVSGVLIVVPLLILSAFIWVVFDDMLES